MDLVTIFKVLFKRKWILIGIPFIAAVAAFLFTMDFKRTYRSTAQLSTGFTISQEVQVTAERFNLYEADVKFNNLIETMSSVRVMTLLSYELLIHDLQNPSEAFRSIEEKMAEDPELRDLNKENMLIIAQAKLDSMSTIDTYVETDRKLKTLLEAYEYNFDKINDDISISRIKNTDYVAINAYTENPFLSAFMVNTFCSQFLRYNTSSISDRSSASVNTFKTLVEQKRKELNEKSEELREFKSNNQMMNYSAESESKVSQIIELETKLENEQRDLRSITLQLEDVNSQIRRAGGSISTSNTDIVELRKQISQLNQRYIAGGSNNQVLLDSLNELRSEQQRLILSASRKTSNSNELDELNEKKNDLEVRQLIAQKDIDATRANLNRLRRNASGYASIEAEIAALEREVNLASDEYKNAQEKYNEALDVAIASENSIKQIQRGLPPSEPEPSKRIIITGLSGVSTFIMCVLIIVLLEYIDISIKNTSNFRDNVDLELLGALNTLELKKTSVVNIFKAAREELDKKGNLFRESLRKLRFAIEKQGKKVYLFTSTKPAEGKSLVIKALSMALSVSGAKILIVDMNFSNNSLTQEFKTGALLEKILDPKENKLAITVTNTKLNNIDIIGCKGGNYSPLEIFDPKRLSTLVSTLKERYDFIFIEGSSLNLYSDSRELSDYVDGVITVFSARSTLQQLDHDSISFVQKLGEKNSGAILNYIEYDNMDS